MKIRVSVIVPVYNVEQYLKKCLSSLVNQTLKDIEIIVVNDGSTDSSQEIIDDFAIKFPDVIKAYKKENGGLSDARNYGIKKAEGIYIAFVDSDDWVEIDMFEKMYKSAKKYNAEIAICNLLKEDENGNKLQYLKQLESYEEGVIHLQKDARPFGELSSFACNKIFKSYLFEDTLFPVGLHFEDIATIPILLAKSKRIVKLNDAFYHYLERQGSITKSHTVKGLDMFKAIKCVEDYVEKNRRDSIQKELKRFFIIQGYYSYLAYVAYVEDSKLLSQMLKELKYELKLRNISRKEIFNYQRNGVNYLQNLPTKKRIYYYTSLINFKLLKVLIKKI